jgi:hypothetical protein
MIDPEGEKLHAALAEKPKNKTVILPAPARQCVRSVEEGVPM